jgi:uncharacterized OsmC-like protein
VQPSDIRHAVSKVVAHFLAHPDDARSEDKPARAALESGLRINVAGPGSWSVTTDMPSALGGEGSAPSPGWLRRAAQAACEATMIALRAAHEGVALDHLEVEVGSVSDDRGMLGMEAGLPAGPAETWSRVKVSARGVPQEKLRQVVEWAEQHSPVTDALSRSVPHKLEVETH